MYLASVDEVKAVVGTFQNASWQGLPVINTTGSVRAFPFQQSQVSDLVCAQANAINSTRTFTVDGAPLVEQLQYIESNATYGQQVWTLANAPVALRPTFNLTGYQDSLVVSPLCPSGNSSQVVWTVNFCFQGASEATADVATLLVNSHTAALLNVTNVLGKGNFTACPSGANSTSTAAAAASGKA